VGEGLEGGRCVAVFIILFERERGKAVNAWGVFLHSLACGFPCFLGLREEGEVYMCGSIVRGVR